MTLVKNDYESNVDPINTPTNWENQKTSVKYGHLNADLFQTDIANYQMSSQFHGRYIQKQQEGQKGQGSTINILLDSFYQMLIRDTYPIHSRVSVLQTRFWLS